MRKIDLVKVAVVVSILMAALLAPKVMFIDTPLLGGDTAFASEKSDLIASIDSTVKPKDKMITHKDELIVQTRLDGKNKKFKVKLKKVGKNSVVIPLELSNGKKAKVLRRVVRLPEFDDVEDGYWAKKHIEFCVAAGLIDKGKSKRFRPEGSITRGKFTKILANAAVGSKPIKPKDDVATDVASNHTYSRYINYAVKTRRVMKLEANGSFRPDDKITRGEAIAAISKLEGLLENWDMFESPFEDLHPRHKNARYISSAKKAGLLKFAEKRGYVDADGLLTNAELAVMLTKISVGKKSLAKLFNWKEGFKIEKAKKKKGKIEEKIALK
jgi:hypothetical protein